MIPPFWDTRASPMTARWNSAVNSSTNRPASSCRTVARPHGELRREHTRHAASRMKRFLPVLLVALIYLPALGSSSSGTHPDESYYLGISAEMDANDAWLTPTLDGQPKWFK